ncbi:lipoprotein [bacterium]|nr:lipoprotein [bacterium]
MSLLRCIFVTGSLLLTACGQTGPLYLPDDTPTEHTQPDKQ